MENAFANLLSKYKKLSSKYRKVEAKNQLLLKENSELAISKNELSKDNNRLTKELDKLKPIMDKFILSSQKLNLLLDNQKEVFDKAGLGYNPIKNQKYLKNMVSKRTIFVSKNA